MESFISKKFILEATYKSLGRSEPIKWSQIIPFYYEIGGSESSSIRARDTTRLQQVPSRYIIYFFLPFYGSVTSLSFYLFTATLLTTTETAEHQQQRQGLETPQVFFTFLSYFADDYFLFIDCTVATRPSQYPTTTSEGLETALEACQTWLQPLLVSFFIQTSRS